MQRLCRRSALCRPTARRVAVPAAPPSGLSVRAQWMSIPVPSPSCSSNLHRCLATAASASSASPPPRRSPSTASSNAFLFVGLAVLAGTAALYITAPSAAAKRHHDAADKHHGAGKTERVGSVDRVAQHAAADNTPATLSPLPTAPPTLTSPTTEVDNDDVTAAPPAGDASQASQSTPASIATTAASNDTNTQTPPPVTTATHSASTSAAPAAPLSHSHSPPAATATSPPRPLSAAEIAHLARYYSAPADEHPSVRNLRILTANRIDEVLDTSPPFLLYLFDPTCAACALYTPIVHALAYALDTSDEEEEEEDGVEEEEEGKEAGGKVEGVRVYVMNDATDYKPGFLSPDEENVLPILKFFPQSTTPSTSSSPATPFQYTGSPHLSAILRYLHTHTNAAWNLDRALQRAQTRLPQLRSELAERGAKRLEQSEDWALYLHSPCGALIREYSMAELMGKYVEGGEGAEGKYEKFVACMEEKEDETMEYFETMAMIANETVQQLREKRDKKRRQGASGGDSSSEMKEADNDSS